MEKANEPIAIFSDAHGLLEPLIAVIDDIKRRGINRIYSLGDNIGVGPNPREVLSLIEENDVISIAGNSEEYCRLGTKPFKKYFNDDRIKSQLWTMSKISSHQKQKIFLYPNFIELAIGEKELVLCHFANDIRFDFTNHSTWTYQNNLAMGKNAYKQFLYTNSKEQLEEIKRLIQIYGYKIPEMKGYISALKSPLFNGKSVESYDAIIQGHVHWKLQERTKKTNYYTIRSLGMAYNHDPVDSASYVILTPKESGYEFEEILVKYNREKMVYDILTSDLPDHNIRKFTCLNADKLNRVNKKRVSPLYLYKRLHVSVIIHFMAHMS